jgi:hypothetical protein
MGAQKGLSEEQKSFFESEGYLIIPDFASDEECTTLISRMEQLVEAFDPATISIFSTKNQVASPSSRRRMNGWITASLPLLQFATCLS